MAIKKLQYSDPLGYRPYDKVEPIYIGGKNLFPYVYRYDKNIYKGINDFIDRFSWMYIRYQSSCQKNKKISIEEFLEKNVAEYEYPNNDIFAETSFALKENKIYFGLDGVKKRKFLIQGIFTIDDCTFYATEQYFFFFNKFNYKQYVYYGDLI